MFLKSALEQTFTAHNDVFHTFSRFLFVSMRLACQNIYIRPCDLACYIVCTVICFNGTCVFVYVYSTQMYIFIHQNKSHLYLCFRTYQPMEIFSAVCFSHCFIRQCKYVRMLVIAFGEYFESKPAEIRISGKTRAKIKLQLK